MDKNVSFLTLIQHIQNDLSDILRDYCNSNKSLKLKVNSTKDTVKLLNIKLKPFIFDENKYFDRLQEDINKFKIDLEQQKKIMENQIKSLKLENMKLIKQIDKMSKEISHNDDFKEHDPFELNDSLIKKTDSVYYNKYIKCEEELSNYKINFEQIIIILRQEENNKIKLEEDFTNLKNTIIDLNGKIQIISCKYEKKCQDYDILDKINNEMRNNYYDLKPKYEEVVRINSELKTKYIEKNTEHNNFLENNIGIYKKLSYLQKRNEELEKDLANYISECSIKDERMMALRSMNVKLENKIKELMKNCGKIRVLEETSTTIQKKYTDLYEIIANLNLEKVNLSKENEELKGQSQCLKKKEEIVEIEIDSRILSEMHQTNQDTSKRFKRNARSSSMASNASVKKY